MKTKTVSYLLLLNSIVSFADNPKKVNTNPAVTKIGTAVTKALDPTKITVKKSRAQKGGDLSGGGNAVVCFSDPSIPEKLSNTEKLDDADIEKITSIEAYDLLEARRPRGKNAIKPILLEPKKEESGFEFALRIIARAYNAVPELGFAIVLGYEAFLGDDEKENDHLIWHEHDGVPQTDDVLPDGQINTHLCALITVARQFQEGTASFLHIDERLFKHKLHSVQSQGTLLTHEFAYWHMRTKNKATDSRSTRKLLGTLLLSAKGGLTTKRLMFDAINLGFIEKPKDIYGKSYEAWSNEYGTSGAQFITVDHLFEKTYLGQQLKDATMDSIRELKDIVANLEANSTESQKLREDYRTLIKGFGDQYKIDLNFNNDDVSSVDEATQILIQNISKNNIKWDEHIHKFFKDATTYRLARKEEVRSALQKMSDKNRSIKNIAEDDFIPTHLKKILLEKWNTWLDQLAHDTVAAYNEKFPEFVTLSQFNPNLSPPFVGVLYYQPSSSYQNTQASLDAMDKRHKKQDEEIEKLVNVQITYFFGAQSKELEEIMNLPVIDVPKQTDEKIK